MIVGQKVVRTSQNDITLFDSVGFALEDYSVLRYINDLSDSLKIYEVLDLIPDLEDCKDLYSSLKTKQLSYIGSVTNSQTFNKKII